MCVKWKKEIIMALEKMTSAAMNAFFSGFHLFPKWKYADTHRTKDSTKREMITESTTFHHLER